MEKIISRKLYLRKIKKYYKKPIIKVITGMRRTWKSYFLKSIFDDMKNCNIVIDNNIFYINKESLDFDFINDYKDLNNYFLKWLKDNNVKWFFIVAIDEIQLIKWWEKFINSILLDYREKLDIFVTGSNSNLLSSELSTLIAWRYIEFHIYPLIFSEYLDFYNWDKNDLFLDYLKYWWLPWLVRLPKEDDLIYEYLRGIYSTIFVKDILYYNKLKTSNIFEKLYIYILKNIWTIFSAKKITDYIKSNLQTKTSLDTIINYINLWLKTYLIYEVNRYNIKWKNVFQVNNKYFSWDIWIRNAKVWFNFAKDITNVLENIIFLELKTRWYNVNVWILWNLEIEFVAEKNWEIIYIQVCYLLSNQDTIDREFWNLLKIKDNWKKYVLSMDNIFETKNEWIIHKNIIDFLLDKDL